MNIKKVKNDNKIEKKSKNLTDLHSHILFELDDGAKDITESMNMIEMYIKNGYCRVAATPHFVRSSNYMTEPEQICSRIDELSRLLKEKGIQFEICAGMEIRLEVGIVEGLREKRLVTLNGSAYVLVEFPGKGVPDYSFDLLYELQINGYIPVIAHPERNPDIISDVTIVNKLVDNGCIIQINKGSVLGEYGEDIKNTSVKLLELGLAHIVSTDCHRTQYRNSELQNLEELLNDIVGMENTSLLLKENPDAIFDNKEVFGMDSDKIKGAPKKKTNWKIVGLYWVIAFCLIIYGAKYAFEKIVDSLLERFVSAEVLKDPILSKRIKSMNNLGIVTRSEIENSKNSGNPIGTVNDSTPQVGLDGIRINESQENVNEDVFYFDEESGQYIDMAMYETTKKGVDPANNASISSKKEDNKYIKVTEKFTNSDRARVVNIIYGSVPRSEINRLKALEEDGLTSEEINDIKATVKNYVSSAEYQELKLLYVKYENSTKK